MEIYKLTASQLVPLLQMLGALVADYVQSPTKPMSTSLRKFVSTPLQWKSLPSLKSAIGAALKGGDKTSALYELSLDIKDSLPAFTSNQEYTTPELTLLKYIRYYLATDNPAALDKIKKNAALFKSPELAKTFMPTVQVSDHKALRRKVKELTGRDGVHLSRDEITTLKDTNPKALEQYGDLRKAHNLDFRTSLMNYVRSKGKDKTDYQDAFKAMTALGFTHSMVPGFIGLIDDTGKWYTKEGDAIEGGAPTVVTYSHVGMNPAYGPESGWVFKGYKYDGAPAHFYTQKYRSNSTDAKFDHLKILMPLLTKIRNRWLAKVRDFDITDKTCVAAVVLEILYFYAARVGTAPGKGVATLWVKNSKVTTQGITLSYLGKDSIPTKHTIKPTTQIQKWLIADLEQLREGKKPSDMLFTIKKGERFVRCSPSQVNAVFHSFGAPSEVSVHKLRTARGTDAFVKEVEKDADKRAPGSDKEALLRWKEYCETVGKLLNHKRGVGTSNETYTGTTAATSYIDVGVQKDLFAKWGFRLPRLLEKISTKGDA